MTHRKILSITITTSLVLATILGYFLFFNDSERLVEFDSEVEQKQQVELYYVPVTNYFSEKENITSVELKETTILAKSEDEDILKKIDGGLTLKLLASLDEVTNEVNKTKGVALIPWYEVGPNLKTLSYDSVNIWDKENVKNYKLGISAEVSAQEEIPEFKPEKIVKINFLGDIMLSRHVNTQMNRYGFDYPWTKIKEFVRDAEITFANLEVPISDLNKSPAAGMSFIAPTKNLSYLKGAGIDVVSVANNHSANFGYNVFKDNLLNLDKVEIGVCGGGLTEAEARRPKVVEVSGIKFAFICHSAVVGSLYAKENSAGVPYLGMEPWYRDDESSIKAFEEDIRAAKKIADVVIVSPHWGVEYKHYPNKSQTSVAQRAIKAGADLVVGTHPHVVQSSEFFEGKYITYSLGNFIFDQEWSEATKQGTVLSGYFYEGRHVSATLHPLQISNYAQPQLVIGSIRQKILNTIKEFSAGLY